MENKDMPALMAILGIINGVKAMQQGNRVGGAASIFGSMYNAGWFNTESSQSFNNTLGDFGARRNYL